MQVTVVHLSKYDNTMWNNKEVVARPKLLPIPYFKKNKKTFNKKKKV